MANPGAIISVVGCAGGASIRGASHVARQKPNQDAVAFDQQRLWTFVAVADGHGSAPHYRSDRGSRFAVEAVMTLMRDLTDQGALREPDVLATRLSGIAAGLVEGWQAQVRADIAADPLPDDDASGGYTVYGSTCVAAAAGPGMALLIQIGDGDIFVGTASTGIETPLPADDTVGEQTYSLCLADAPEHVKVKLFSAPSPLGAPDFILVATDGFAKSFGDEAAVNDVVGKCRQATHERGLAPVIAELEPWLAQCSQMGSGDDTSVAIFTVDRATEVLPQAVPTAQAARPEPAAAPSRGFALAPVLIALLLGGILGVSAMAWAARGLLELRPLIGVGAAPAPGPLRSLPTEPRSPEPAKAPATAPR